MRRLGPGLYLLATLAAAVSGFLALEVGTMAQAVAQCRWPVPTPKHAFLAYCAQPRFGDYEHPAYALGLQPRVAAHLGAARLLVLGNSGEQVAFSTAATAAALKGLPYYLLGFGYSENGRFAEDLFRAAHLHPKVLVINADPFFTETRSEPAKTLDAPTPWSLVDIVVKRITVAIEPALCRSLLTCIQLYPAVYRDEDTGAWLWQTTLVPNHPTEVDGTVRHPFPRQLVPTLLPAAARMLATFGVPRPCVILTGTANSDLNGGEMATWLATELGTALVVPNLTGLRTLDGYHLDPPSAERWSAAFFDQAKPIVDRCLAGTA